MDKNIEYIEQKLFQIVVSKIKSNFNNQGCLEFNVNNLAEELQIDLNILNEHIPMLCKNLLRRHIVITHDNGNLEQISILISINYGNNTDLILELNPEIRYYQKYLTDIYL